MKKSVTLSENSVERMSYEIGVLMVMAYRAETDDDTRLGDTVEALIQAVGADNLDRKVLETGVKAEINESEDFGWTHVTRYFAVALSA